MAADSHDKSMLKLWRGLKDHKERLAQSAFADGDLNAARRYAEEADEAEAQAGKFAKRIFRP